MKTTSVLRAFARSEQFLQAGAPTGLTGLLTHASPRSALIHIYSSTLDKLKQLPESSVYRQSTEALTKHRLSIVESVKPAGLSEWQAKVRHMVEKHPQAFDKVASQANPSEVNFITRYTRAEEAKAAREKDPMAGFQTPRELQDEMSAEEIEEAHRQSEADLNFDSIKGEVLSVEAEPDLTSEQIIEIENKIGAGLIEEVIQVAEGESLLVDNMFENGVWEELVEKPVEGQWTYHERDTHVPKTGAP